MCESSIFEAHENLPHFGIYVSRPERPVCVRLALNISAQFRVRIEAHETLSSTHAIRVSTQSSIYA
jgi:hypothetical protein